MKPLLHIRHMLTPSNAGPTLCHIHRLEGLACIWVGDIPFFIDDNTYTFCTLCMERLPMAQLAATEL